MMKLLNRAKAIDGTGGYIVSQSVKFENEKMFLYSIPFRQWVECEESTRALNFEDMLDSQGNKIFASLNEDGKGGDILEYSRLTNKMWCEGKKEQIKTTLCKFNTRGLNILSILKANGNDAFKVIGIKE